MPSRSRELADPMASPASRDDRLVTSLGVSSGAGDAWVVVESAASAAIAVVAEVDGSRRWNGQALSRLDVPHADSFRNCRMRRM